MQFVQYPNKSAGS